MFDWLKPTVVTDGETHKRTNRKPTVTDGETHRHTYRQRIENTVIQLEPVTAQEGQAFLQRLVEKRGEFVAAGSRKAVDKIDILILRLTSRHYQQR